AGRPVFARQRASTPGDVAVSPIECWWKTDRSAIRVGEHFQLTLTCAVLDTDKVKVVVDESSLAPTALHLVPFEIVSGTRFRDIRNSPRRFFQYAYTMRVLGEGSSRRAVSVRARGTAGAWKCRGRGRRSAPGCRRRWGAARRWRAVGGSSRSGGSRSAGGRWCRRRRPASAMRPPATSATM